MFFKKQKKQQQAPILICVHDWHLMNLHTTTDQWGTNELYVLGCIKCNATKTLDEYEYNKFIEIFDVKNRKGNKS